ncbi:MAG: BatA domain-containing protein [Minwuia sp.]|uniref:BatA domain-containing protein n=1 Tax=Minwuia sp. TaxID=2493630 RepID=UPI003A8C2D51
MSGLLSFITFGQPLILLGLLSLPVIWWLLKATPPAPERVIFPPARLIFEMVRQEETPHRTPWWLLLLRLLIAALLVLGLSRPILNPGGEFGGSGPVVLIVDDGWAAAESWPERVRSMVDITNRARREDRVVAILRTTPDPDGVAPRAAVMSAAQAADTVRGMVPRAWAPDYPAARAALDDLDLSGAVNVFWMSSGTRGGRRLRNGGSRATAGQSDRCRTPRGTVRDAAQGAGR